MQFEGFNAVVTGASSGIGRAIAAGLARGGAALWVVGRSRQRLEEALCGSAAAARSMSAVEADFAAPEGAAAAAEQLLRLVDRVDILVHCAGAISLGPIGTAPVEQLDEQYRINVRAPFVLTQALLPLLRESRGQVVFVNSTAGLKANANAAQYSATKHALKALADSLRDEENRHGIRVLSVFSGRTGTPMQRAITDWEGKAFLPEYLLQPEDVAAPLLHALSMPRTAELTDLSLRPLQKYPA
jgi:NAD(P)-dependent dehydrogenase (short-subunit alcohol dehydrogenase family)